MKGLGTGGIKPCVASFGGQQFEPTQTKWINSYFSIFYMMGNIASIVATIITPILRSQVKCYEADCYPVAFSIPTALMLIAILSFVAGTRLYKKKERQRGGSNLYVEIFGCIFRALKNKFFGRSNKSSKDNEKKIRTRRKSTGWTTPRLITANE